MFEIAEIPFDQVKLIENLWEKNRQYHENSSEYFSKLYGSICFDDKIKNYEGLSEDMLKITVAKENGKYIGYCISTIIEDKGEIASLHVDEFKRGTGVGKELVVKHLKWMKEKKCKVIGVTVSQENENTIGFYRKFGFYPNTLYMQQISE